MGIGQTLDVVRTAEELAEATVPRFADLVTVDMPEPVLRGGEGTGEPGADLRRVVTRDIEEMPASTGPRRQQGRQVRYPSSSAQARCLAEGGPVPAPEPEAGIRSLIAAPLSTHGGIFGVVTFMRRSTSFEDDDLALAEELSTRTAVCIDNARRFVRERAMALALRRAMLPRSLPEQNAVEVAYRYLPAQQAISGDWFDVIPLSGGRVALVVGDVAGSGLYAAAAMGRLRTAISNFSALDLAPEEILGQLDDLVRRLACEQADRADDDATGSLGIAAENLMTDGAGDPVTGTTCLYAVYDPAGGQCTLASAGHPPPAVVHPDGSVEFPHKSAGPPLGLPPGLGGPPFETAEVRLPEGSKLVLYTDGLLADDPDDPRPGMERLRAALGSCGRSAEEACASALTVLPPGRRSDDVVLLVARTRALPADHVACWDLSVDPAAVSRVRTEVARRLSAWNLDELGFTTELIFSELVTNAIRYGSEPISARLLLDRKLICEVSDASETSPRPRRAAITDEGGRGLFLVAQLAERWGTRYTQRGKIIWAEQFLEGEPAGQLQAHEKP